jgi:hypothetical protein
MKLGKSLLAFGCGMVGATVFAALPAVAQQKPMSCSFSPTTSATATWVPTVAASCAARRRRASTNLPARVCGSLNS